MGEWIHHVVNGMDYYECSECKTYFYKKYMMRKNYCSNCGADMRNTEKPETCKGCLEPCIMYEPDMRACKKKVREVSE